MPYGELENGVERINHECVLFSDDLQEEYCKKYIAKNTEPKYTHEEICNGWLKLEYGYYKCTVCSMEGNGYLFHHSWLSYEQLQSMEIVPIPPQK
jgi:hypothetical protein